jgi:hypothetical protein
VVVTLGILRLAVGWMTGGAVAFGALDRADDRPPYRQIADHLRAAIECGELHDSACQRMLPWSSGRAGT